MAGQSVPTTPEQVGYGWPDGPGPRSAGQHAGIDLWFCGTPASFTDAAPASTRPGRSQGTGAIVSDELGPFPVSFERPPQPRTATSATDSVKDLMKRNEKQEPGHRNFAKSGSNYVQTCVKPCVPTIDLSLTPNAMMTTPNETGRITNGRPGISGYSWGSWPCPGQTPTNCFSRTDACVITSCCT